MNNLDLIHEKLGGKKYERYVATNCIFHDDHKPSLFIYPDRYFCAGCGARGTTASLIRRFSSIPERTIIYTTKRNENPFRRWMQIFNTMAGICTTACNTRQSNYLSLRGVSLDKQQTLGIGVLEDYVIFPIRTRYDEIVGAVARTIGNRKDRPKYILPPEQSPKLLYVPDWGLVKEQDSIYVTFGIIDAITLCIMGKAACSTTTGQHISIDAFDGLKKKIIFVPDEFEEQSAYKISTKLGLRGSVKMLNYPYGCKDPNDLYLYDKHLLEMSL